MALQRGTISSIEPGGKKARVLPEQVNGIVTQPLAIHSSIRGNAGKLEKGTEVVFVVFNDRSGIILCRADGDVYS